MAAFIEIGADEALRRILDALTPLPSEKAPLLECVGRVAAETVHARANSPSLNISLMDGYAVNASVFAGPAVEYPVKLRVIGASAAGIAQSMFRIAPDETVRVLTGAPVPQNATAVIAEESVRVDGDRILVDRPASMGAHMLPKGNDVSEGQALAHPGDRISPGQAGLLAAAGVDGVRVVRNGIVSILSTGDEIAAPGRPAADGQVYASNLIMLSAWCRNLGWTPQSAIVPDDREKIKQALERAAHTADALITCGGTMQGDRDFAVQVLESLGWDRRFQGIRMVPGKAAGFGFLREKPVFMLPGGPAANFMAFLQMTLPGLQRLSGHPLPGLPEMNALLARDVIHDRHVRRTRFILGTMETTGPSLPIFHSLRSQSRLLEIAQAQAVVRMPEGVSHLPAGSIVPVQIL